MLGKRSGFHKILQQTVVCSLNKRLHICMKVANSEKSTSEYGFCYTLQWHVYEHFNTLCILVYIANLCSKLIFLNLILSQLNWKVCFKCNFTNRGYFQADTKETHIDNAYIPIPDVFFKFHYFLPTCIWTEWGVAKV